MAPETHLREKPALCYQCGKCSAGCPVSDEMDILPHQVIHLAALGMEDRVLDKNTIWICAGCNACAVRCPNDIDVTAVMDDLRHRAVQDGHPCPMPFVLQFHKAFIRDMGRRGRVHEVRMMGEYNLMTKRPFHNAMLGPKMFLKGRLGLLPPKAIKGFKKWFKKVTK